MISRDVLKDAVESGLITEAQKEALLVMAVAHNQSSEPGNLALQGHNPELDTGLMSSQFSFSLSDLFISAGLVFFFSSLMGMVDYFLPETESSSPYLSGLIIIPVVWLIGEYVSGRRRLTLPSICVLGMLLYSILTFSIEIVGESYLSLTSFALYSGTAFLVSLVYYARFRLPFSLFTIALSAILFLMNAYTGLVRDQVFDLLDPRFYTGDVVAVLIGLGLIVFALAMVYDFKDPARQTNDNARAFWLHMVASPILVHVVAIKLIVSGQQGSLLLIAYLAAYTLVALIIDRRIGVLSAIFYLSASLVYTSTTARFSSLSLFSTTLLPAMVSATTILVISLFWSPIRRLLMKKLPGGAWKNKLPA